MAQPANWGAKKHALDARQNVGTQPQPHVSLATPFVPFRVLRRGRRGASAALVEEGRGEAFAAVRLHKRLLGRAVPGKCAEGRERRSSAPGRSDFLPVHRSDVENPRCRSRSPVRRTPGSPSFSPVDESLGLFDTWVRQRAAWRQRTALRGRGVRHCSSAGRCQRQEACVAGVSRPVRR